MDFYGKWYSGDLDVRFCRVEVFRRYNPAHNAAVKWLGQSGKTSPMPATASGANSLGGNRLGGNSLGTASAYKCLFVRWQHSMWFRSGILHIDFDCLQVRGHSGMPDPTVESAVVVLIGCVYETLNFSHRPLLATVMVQTLCSTWPRDQNRSQSSVSFCKLSTVFRVHRQCYRSERTQRNMHFPTSSAVLPRAMCSSICGTILDLVSVRTAVRGV